MKTATEFLNAVRVDYISESHREYFEEKIKDAMERYANYRVSQALPMQADQHLFNVLLDVCGFTALDDDMQMIKDAIAKDLELFVPLPEPPIKIRTDCMCKTNLREDEMRKPPICSVCNREIDLPF